MRTIGLGVVACACLVVPSLALAEGDEVAARIAGQLGYAPAAKAHLASKVWPADRSRTIVALAVPAEVNEEGVGSYDLEVLVVDSATSAIRARYTARKAIASDAVRFLGLSIDTAPYRVAKGVRAFGVRLTYEGASRVNPYGAEVLELFVEAARGLRPLVHALVVTTSGGEWDGSCEGSFTDTRRTIRIGEGASRGFQDLVIEGRVTERTNRRAGDDCDEEVRAGKPERLTLRYDGKAYGVPAELRFE